MTLLFLLSLSHASLALSRFWFSLLLSALFSPITASFQLSGLIFGVYSVHCSSSGFTSDGVTLGMLESFEFKQGYA